MCENGPIQVAPVNAGNTLSFLTKNFLHQLYPINSRTEPPEADIIQSLTDMNAVTGYHCTARDLAWLPFSTEGYYRTEVKARGGFPITARPRFLYVGNDQSLYYLEIFLSLFFNDSHSAKYDFECGAGHASELENLRIAWESRSTDHEMRRALEPAARIDTKIWWPVDAGPCKLAPPEW